MVAPLCYRDIAWLHPPHEVGFYHRILVCPSFLMLEEWVNIALRRFLHIEAIWRQNEARSRYYVLLLFRMTSRFFYSTQYHRQHCTLHAFWSTVYTQPRWQISGQTRIQTWYLQVTSPSRYEWAIGAGPNDWGIQATSSPIVVLYFECQIYRSRWPRIQTAFCSAPWATTPLRIPFPLFSCADCFSDPEL